MNSIRLALLAAALLAAVTVEGLPTGAPEACCVNMLPAHGVPVQSGPAPFQIRARKNADGTYTAALESKSADVFFKGFLLQARRESTGTIIGGFTSIPAGTTQYLNCLVADNAVTHTSNVDKLQLSFTWDPRGADVNGVVFVSTFVQDAATFWTFIRSEDLGGL